MRVGIDLPLITQTLEIIKQHIEIQILMLKSGFIRIRRSCPSAEHKLIHLIERHRFDLYRLENRLEKMDLVRVDVIEELALVEERLKHAALETVESNDERSPVKVLMERVLERELVGAGDAREAHRYGLLLMHTPVLSERPNRRRLALIVVEVHEVYELDTIECQVVFVKVLSRDIPACEYSRD